MGTPFSAFSPDGSADYLQSVWRLRYSQSEVLFFLLLAYLLWLDSIHEFPQCHQPFLTPLLMFSLIKVAVRMRFITATHFLINISFFGCHSPYIQSYFSSFILCTALVPRDASLS